MTPTRTSDGKQSSKGAATGAPLRRRLAICATTSVLGLLTAEGFARVATPRPGAPLPAQGRLLENVEHPELLFINQPEASKTVHYDEGSERRWSVTMRTNEHRFRGPAVAREKPAGVLRVACVGDSHTFGDGVGDEETWPARLQAYAEGHVEVLNCGVNGYDTLQEALWYERYVEPFDPDLVLLAFFPNDVAVRGLAAAEKPDRLAAWTHPRRGGAIRFVREHSVAVDVVCDRLYRQRSFAARLAGWSSRYVDGDPGWERAKAALVRLRDRCAAEGRELRLVLFPYLFRAGDAFASHEVLATVAAFCRSQGVDCHDAEPALLAALAGGDARELRVSRRDFHANGRAYDAAARSVAAWLAASGLPFRER